MKNIYKKLTEFIINYNIKYLNLINKNLIKIFP